MKEKFSSIYLFLYMICLKMLVPTIKIMEIRMEDVYLNVLRSGAESLY